MLQDNADKRTEHLCEFNFYARGLQWTLDVEYLASNWVELNFFRGIVLVVVDEEDILAANPLYFVGRGISHLPTSPLTSSFATQ